MLTRTEDRQSEVITTLLKSVHYVAAELNVTHYVVFDLRDADSAKPDLFHQYGIPP